MIALNMIHHFQASALAEDGSDSELVSYRAFKRISVSGNWKTNTGTSMIENIDLTDNFKHWADLASDMFGGLEICTVDAIFSKKVSASTKRKGL
jgi:hypothetical protein